MSAKHTSGPWVARPGRVGSYWEIEKDDTDTEDPWAVATAYEHADDGAAEANARLIAAAPDFMEVAPDAADILEHYAAYIRELPSVEFERHPYLPAIEQVASDLRAAIAKALGQEGGAL